MMNLIMSQAQYEQGIGRGSFIISGSKVLAGVWVLKLILCIFLRLDVIVGISHNNMQLSVTHTV